VLLELIWVKRKGGKPTGIQNTEETTMKTLKIYNTLIAQIACDSSCFNAPAEEYADALFEALEKDDTDLAEYADDYHGATYYKKLRKVTMSAEWIGRKLYGVAICEVNDDWTDDDTAQLKEYLSGQYSDGWGEGFEQNEIESYTEVETCEEYDEEADEYYESEWEVCWNVYISFWQDRNFRIMTEAELNA
jgi:hypothetical protein